MRVAAAALALICIAAAGCGYSNPDPRDNARATAETFLESCARNDSEAATDVLTDPLRASFSRIGSPPRACSRLLGVGAPSLDDPALLNTFRRTKIVSLEVRGGLARTSLAPPQGARSEIGLRFSAGEWKVDSPPGSG
jgi:hypothetical protein